MIPAGISIRINLVLPVDVRTHLEAIASYLERDGIEGYLVGGSVRDAILGRPSDDLDVAVRAEIGPVARGLGRALRASVVVLDRDRDIYRLVFRDEGRRSRKG